MSHQDSSHQNTHQSQDHLIFLKSVVDGEDSGGQARSDSDKENDSSGIGGVVNTTTTSTSTKEFSLNLSKDVITTDSTMSKEDTAMWDDFYNEEEFEGIAADNQSDEFSLMRPGTGTGNDRMLEKVEEEEEEDYVGESNATDTITDSVATTKDNNNSNSDGGQVGGEDGGSMERTSKRKRKKRLFRRVRPPSSPASRSQLGGSHPNLGQHHQHNNSYSRADSLGGGESVQLETMSETSGGSERKLSRRKQVARPRCAGPAPGGDRLQQKYQELEQLMLKPLANPAAYAKQTRNQMLRLQGMNPTQYNHHHSSATDPSSLPPTGQQQPVPREQGQASSVIQVIEEDTNQAYSTIRTVHVVNKAHRNNPNRPKSAHPRRRPLSGQRQTRPQSAGQARPATGNNSECSSGVLSNINLNNGSSKSRGRRRDGANGNRKMRSDSSASGGSHKKSDRSESRSKEREYNDSSFEDGARSRSTSQSPGRNIQSTETHLKHSSNPALRQWLKVKDKEHRKQKLEERKKKRRERAEKQEEELKKQEFSEKAEEKVKEWMTKKRKEAWRQAKEEKRWRKEEEMQLAEQQQQRTAESLRGKMFTPVQRPEGKLEAPAKTPAQQNEENNDTTTTTTPQPPKSKFVFKRPVSGRVRLMKLQQERKDDTRRSEAKKKEMDKLLADEKQKKMRVSYDQWLVNKREDDYAKRQHLAKQRALAKSDPELDRLVPEMAKRRIENIRRGKKRIESGNSVIDKSVNESFGGGNFGEEEGKLSAASFRLEVSGDRKSLKQRPSSAKPTPGGGMLNPKQSKSPRRPQSANPRIQALMDGVSKDNEPDHASFKLPFPPQFGVPKHVAARQEKLFSPEIIASHSFNAEDNSEGKEESVMDGNGVEKQERVEIEAQPEETSLQQEVESPSVEALEGDEENKQEDESFFVTHGNLNIEKEEAEKEEEPTGVVSEEEKSPEEMAQTEEKPTGRETTEDEASYENVQKDSEKEEKEDEEEKVELEAGVGDKDDEKMNDNDENGTHIPLLEFGDDDADLLYEEESEQMEEETDMNYAKEKEMRHSARGESGDSLEVRASAKKVSFSERNTIHEDPLFGISNDEEFFDNYNNPQSDNVENKVDGDESCDPPTNQTDSEPFDYEALDDIEGYEEDGEPEDERGGYFDGETPRDDDF